MMRRRTVGLLLALTIAACSGRSLDTPLDSLPPYYPPASFDSLNQQTFARVLTALSEQPLYATKGPDVTRLLVLPASRDPFVVRVERRAEAANLFVRSWVRGRRGTFPGLEDVPGEGADRPVSMSQWSGLEEQLDWARFWELPSDRRPTAQFDGTWFVMEARRADRYHVVARFSPEKDEPNFDRACRYVLGMAGASTN